MRPIRHIKILPVILRRQTMFSPFYKPPLLPYFLWSSWNYWNPFNFPCNKGNTKGLKITVESCERYLMFSQFLKPPLSPRSKFGIPKPYDRGTTMICRNEVGLEIHSISPVTGETQRGQNNGRTI